LGYYNKLSMDGNELNSSDWVIVAFSILPGTLHIANVPCFVMLLAKGKIFIPNLTSLHDTQFPVPSGAESNPYMNDVPLWTDNPVPESVYYH